WTAIVYTTRPANRGSGTAAYDPPSSTGTFGGAPLDTRAAASRFSREVGENVAAIVGCASFAPLLTTRPGTFTRANFLAPVSPSARGSGPADKPAAREAGGFGTTVVLAGFSPTIARFAPPIAPGTDGTAGGSAESTGAAGGMAGSVPIGAATGVPIWGPERCLATAANSGAAANPTAVTARGFTGGAVNARACGLGPAAGNGSASGSTTISARGPSGSGSIACLCMRTGGGAKARRGPLGVTPSIRAATGVPTWGPERCFSSAATFGASCSGATGGTTGSFTAGRTTFGFSAGSGSAGFRSAAVTFGASGSGAT